MRLHLLVFTLEEGEERVVRFGLSLLAVLGLKLIEAYFGALIVEFSDLGAKLLLFLLKCNWLLAFDLGIFMDQRWNHLVLHYIWFRVLLFQFVWYLI